MALAVILEVDRTGDNRGIHQKLGNRLGTVDGIEGFGGMRKVAGLIIAGIVIFLLGSLSGMAIACICVSLGEDNKRSGRK